MKSILGKLLCSSTVTTQQLQGPTSEIKGVGYITYRAMPLKTHPSDNAGSRIMHKLRFNFTLKASGCVIIGPTAESVTRSTEPKMHTWLRRSLSSNILLPSNTTV